MRTIFLPEYISDDALRQVNQAAYNKCEGFNSLRSGSIFRIGAFYELHARDFDAMDYRGDIPDVAKSRMLRILDVPSRFLS